MGEHNLLLGNRQIPQSVRKRRTGWIIAFVVAASQALICKGFMSGLMGPTFQYLALNTNSEIDKVSMVSSGLMFGFAISAVMFSALKRFTDGKTLSVTAFALFVMSAMSFCVPFVKSVTLLVVLATIVGVVAGYALPALLSFYLTMWGAVASRPYVQLHHLMMSVGALLAPPIVEPFLHMAGQRLQQHAICSRHNVQLSAEIHNTTRADAASASGSSNPVSWVFFLFGGYVFIIGLIFFILILFEAETKISEHNCDEADERLERPTREVWPFFIAVFMYNFFCLACYIVFEQYIYSVATCSQLQMNIVLNIWGENSEIVTWICALVYGVGVATLIPCGLSWASQVTNMAGKYLFVFITGGGIGTAVMVRVGGAIFQSNPFSVVYFVTGLCVATGICFACMNITAKMITSTYCH